MTAVPNLTSDGNRILTTATLHLSDEIVVLQHVGVMLAPPRLLVSLGAIELIVGVLVKFIDPLAQEVVVRLRVRNRNLRKMRSCNGIKHFLDRLLKEAGEEIHLPLEDGGLAQQAAHHFPIVLHDHLLDDLAVTLVEGHGNGLRRNACDRHLMVRAIVCTRSRSIKKTHVFFFREICVNTNLPDPHQRWF